MKNRPFDINAVVLNLDSAADCTQMRDILHYIAAKNLWLGIISSKSPAAIHNILKALGTSAADIAVIVSKQDAPANRRAAMGAKAAVKKLDLRFDQILMVSSNPADILAGQKIGAVTAYLRPQSDSKPPGPSCDFGISDIMEIKKIIRMGIPLPAGKLPNELLGEFLDDFIFDDPAMLINPGIGQDTAAVDITSEQVLVLKSDPITFATDSIGQYAVLINANDIATSGARPRWLLTTLMFPCGITASKIRYVVDELRAFCQQWDITLCGGHTEITDAVSRPVVVGMMAGTVAKKNLIDKAEMGIGDRILLTKRIAVEGTAIIAREFGKQLKEMAFTDTEIDNCRKFLSRISIIPEANIAAASAGTSAMHDVTEGGVATALQELGIAGGHRLRIDINKIPVFPETQKFCSLLNINPLGLIGSGSLLICSRPGDYKELMSALRKAEIEITCIGEVLDKGQGIEAYEDQRHVDWPDFEVDEITKLFLG